MRMTKQLKAEIVETLFASGIQHGRLTTKELIAMMDSFKNWKQLYIMMNEQKARAVGLMDEEV